MDFNYEILLTLFKDVLNFHSSKQSSASKIHLEITSQSMSTQLPTTSTRITTTTTPNNGYFDTNHFSLKWTNSNESTDFVLKTNMISGTSALTGYYSFGFSTDRRMGNDDVTICKFSSLGLSTIEHYWNPGRTTPVYLDNSKPTLGYSKALVQFENRVITCTFTRQNLVENNKQHFDLKNSYYIVWAIGELNSNGGYKINFLKTEFNFFSYFIFLQENLDFIQGKDLVAQR